jgi:curved DNA-binding protein CbpA
MTCYEIFGIPTTASIDDIVRAHRTLVKKYHPDRLGDASLEEIKRAQEKFTQVQEAYETLMRRRAEYDEQLRAEAESSFAASPPPDEEKTDYVHSPPQSPPPAPPPTVRRKPGIWSPVGRMVFSSFGMVLLAFCAIYFIETHGTNEDAAIMQWALLPVYPSFSRYHAYRAEQFEGTIRNPATNASAELKISLVESNGRLTGCMAVGQPFSGSGPLRGSYSGPDFDFSVKTSSGKYRIRGKRREGDMGGTYLLEPTHNAAEGGTFTMGRVEDVDEDESLSYVTCPTDAELHQR